MIGSYTEDRTDPLPDQSSFISHANPQWLEVAVGF
jgi:hypothetical protein